MFTTPPAKIMVNTRSTASKMMEEKKPQTSSRPTVSGTKETQYHTPITEKRDETKVLQSCASSVVKSEHLVSKPPSQTSRNSANKPNKPSSSSSSIRCQKKKLELEAAKRKARIQMELIDKQLAADLAELDEYSPPSEISEPNDRSDIEKWVERSQQELELQQATMVRNDKGKPRPSDETDTDGPVQQLASALTQLITTSTKQQNTHLLSRLSTPRDLPVFTGNPMDWLQFQQAYRESTEVCTFTEGENLWRLRKCLRGPAQEAVSALLVSGTSPEVVMSTLQLQFGNADVIVSYYMSEIKKMCTMTVDYCKEIVPFSIKVKNYVAAVQALGKKEYLEGMDIATIVLSKLPTTLLSKWGDYSYPLITVGSSKPRLVMLSDFLTEEALKMTTCSATILQLKSDSYKRKQYDQVHNIQTVLNVNEQSERKCRYCRKHNHSLPECKRFNKALRKDRWSYVKRFGICFKCLVAHHSRETCLAPNCNVNNCEQSHHRLLHFEPHTGVRESVPVQVPETEIINNINYNSSVLLKVIPIKIRGPRGIEHATALLDDGSTVSLISSQLAARAGLTGVRECIRVRGAFDNSEVVCETQLVNLSLSGADNKLYTIRARVVDNLNLVKQNVSKISLSQFTHLNSISKYLCLNQLEPQVLIGQDNFHLLLPLETKISRPDEPCATLTPLGWCLHGRVPKPLPGPEHYSTLFLTNEANVHETETERVLHDIHEEVRRSIMIESTGISSKPRQNSEDLRAEQILDKTLKIVDGRWQVGLPWKDEECLLPDSYPTALSRLKGVERKMKSDTNYAHKYNERINHLLVNDFAEELNRTVEHTPRTWYLPHFAVNNPNKNKLRLVFDAAAKTNGLCLNDYLLKGPDLLASLLGIMLRFRENPVAVTGDIRDMFLRVKIREEDRDSFRFLYKLDGTLKTYRMTSLIFGANCSPFIAQHVKNKNAQLYEKSMPAAANAIYTQHYMDDYIDSLPNEESAIKLVHDVTLIHKQGGFEIRNWTSNSKRVLDSLPEKSLGDAAVKFKIGEQFDGERTLSLLWNPNDDTLSFDVSFKRIPKCLIDASQRPTKRQILQIIMSIFDVYGFLSPYTINGKIILQETWKLKISWDDDVPDLVFDKWIKWISLLHSISNIKLPRYYPSATAYAGVSEMEYAGGSATACTGAGETEYAGESAIAYAGASETDNKPVPSRAPLQQETPDGAPAPEPLPPACYTCLQLHIFCDASTQAMSAVGYWRWKDNRAHVAFITGRSRVAPIKIVSVPRLELQAAVMAARLAETIIQTHKIKPIKKYFWCDSSTVLRWIRNTARNYKQFVAHRLGEIDSLTEIAEWRYVPTKLNVADIATRECYDLSVLEKEWKYGPTFLQGEEDGWPRDFSIQELEIKNTELDMECINYIEIENKQCNLPVPDIRRFSSWIRLLKATSMVLKFINRCRKLTYDCDDTMERAEVLLLRKSQSESFEKEIIEIKNNRCVQRSSKILTLSPYLDEYGVLRVGGRISAAAGILPETKNPIILDGRSHIAVLIVKHYHEHFAHGNQETVVNEVKQRYWITRLRPVTKTVTSQCMRCRIQRCKPEVPRMGDLPTARVAHHQRPFTHCGVDLFGPMEVSVGRRREKRYGVLFTCMTVRAIHIEIVTTLTSDSLIMAIRRMAARRSWPKFLYSDNGTNLKGADTELRRSIQGLNEEYLKDVALNYGTKWSFIPPLSPHWGGAWERLIRSVKTSLHVVLNERAPRDETLSTLLAEVENIVNSRPLTHVSVDPNSLETLTPNHFLVGTKSSLPMLGIFEDSDLYLRKQWRISQRLADMYWQRWVKEILPDMLPRPKWQQEHRNLQVGDLVLVVDPNGPRNLWPKGIVEEVFPGKDGRVRKVKIRTTAGVHTRSAARVARIPIKDE